MRADSIDNIAPANQPGWFLWALGQQPASHYFDNDGARIHFLSWGLEARDKPALLFVHGFRSHARWWDFIAPFFTEHYRVLSIDLSGYGDSDHRDHYDNYTHARDILALMEHLNLHTLTAVGHSFGAGRLFRACGLRGDAFDHIIALDAYVLISGEEPGEDSVRKVTNRSYPDLDTALASFRLSPRQEGDRDWLVEYIARHSYRLAEGRWVPKFDQRLHADDIRYDDGDAMLARVKCPVDYLVAENSALVSQSLAARILALLPGGRRRVLIPGGQHHLMISSPEALISTLQALL